jgi:hypothetical protein
LFASAARTTGRVCARRPAAIAKRIVPMILEVKSDLIEREGGAD